MLRFPTCAAMALFGLLDVDNTFAPVVQWSKPRRQNAAMGWFAIMGLDHMFVSVLECLNLRSKNRDSSILP